LLTETFALVIAKWDALDHCIRLLTGERRKERIEAVTSQLEWVLCARRLL
jgi:hypothetical protein